MAVLAGLNTGGMGKRRVISAAVLNMVFEATFTRVHPKLFPHVQTLWAASSVIHEHVTASCAHAIHMPGVMVNDLSSKQDFEA